MSLAADREPTTRDVIGRRDALRRAAILGGALVWSTPVVQTIAMRGAAAGTTVAGACMAQLDLKVRYEDTVYCLKFPEGDFTCGGSPPTSETTFSSSTGGCFGTVDDCSGGPIPVSVTASSLDGGATWTVALPAGVELIEGWSNGCPGAGCVHTSCPPGTVGPIGCVFSCS